MDQRTEKGYLDFLAQRREWILSSMASAARKAGRDPQEVSLLAVSKTVGVDEVALAWKAGYRMFAENRPQELTRKLAGVSEHPEMASVTFHMIGNLQTNKVNQVVGHVGLIHSVSSLHLAQAVSKRSVAAGLVSHCLIEVNVSGEASKSGLSPEEVHTAIEGLLALPGLEFEGLMTMAPRGSLSEARRTFSGLRELRDALRGQTGLALATLSCGMSDDFEVAVEEGSTIVRLGRTVFDQGYVP